MIPRVTFLSIAAFWVAMNMLLWRSEYGSRGSGIPVPVDLVWRKVLTAPDTSSRPVYKDGQKPGFREFSTSVEQAMAVLDEDKPPPEGLVARAGYQIRSEEHTSELQSLRHLVCRLLLEKITSQPVDSYTTQSVADKATPGFAVGETWDSPMKSNFFF